MHISRRMLDHSIKKYIFLIYIVQYLKTIPNEFLTHSGYLIVLQIQFSQDRFMIDLLAGRLLPTLNFK